MRFLEIKKKKKKKIQFDIYVIKIYSIIYKNKITHITRYPCFKIKTTQKSTSLKIDF